MCASDTHLSCPGNRCAVNTSLRLLSCVDFTRSPGKKQFRSLEPRVCPGYLWRAGTETTISGLCLRHFYALGYFPQRAVNTCLSTAGSAALGNRDDLKLHTSRNLHFKSGCPKPTPNGEKIHLAFHVMQ